MFFEFNTNPKSVLVIDDDSSLRRQIFVHLKYQGKLDVIQAENGSNGLRKAEFELPNLIILDWMLPDIAGPDVLIKLKSSPKTQKNPVLMLTGRNKVGNIEHAFSMGAEAYLTKPFSLNKLGDKVTEILKA